MKCISRSMCHVLIFLIIIPALSAQSDSEAWWKNRPLRIYHPNMREIEAEDFDVEKFIKDCKDLHAEAIVFSTGGPFFYRIGFRAPLHFGTSFSEALLATYAKQT